MPDTLENEFNGILIAPADANAIEAAVLRLAESNDLRKRLGSAAQETAKRYTWARSAKQLEAFFRHIMELEGRSD
jgi:glycosyltransferase involved in cell wall biosynthesis